MLLGTTSVAIQNNLIKEVQVLPMVVEGADIDDAIMVDYGSEDDFEDVAIENKIIKDPLHKGIAEHQLYSLKCVDTRCAWCFRSSSLHDSEIFKRMLSQRHATSVTIAKMVKNKYVNLKSTYTPAEIMDDMRNQYGIRMNYKKAYRSREKALEMLRGSPPKSYRKLLVFLYMVNKKNPGSFTTLHKIANGHFLYAFVALSASIRGWKYCMPTVVVDGTFLKSSYAGTMLCATVLNAAGKILPLAYAIVDSENDASWDWSFRKLKQAYGERHNMYIVSDWHDSILKKASNVYPDVPHYNFIYHVWNNVKGRFKRDHERLKPIFFAMANAYTRADFDHLMEDMDNIDDRVRGYQFDVSYEKWSIAHSTVNRSMVMTLNIAGP
ncbi:uncharacterized protein LOC132644275 [Lycium barbarum]|uniref:uncharacterized protein LOC132644275 n=1 Tax=Lycium barbarum TaxID=112863 RepID=UPI00293E37DF|nr:uncharacterized protein LOC132644275 [Lycium barbarum]